MYTIGQYCRAMCTSIENMLSEFKCLALAGHATELWEARWIVLCQSGSIDITVSKATIGRRLFVGREFLSSLNTSQGVEERQTNMLISIMYDFTQVILFWSEKWRDTFSSALYNVLCEQNKKLLHVTSSPSKLRRWEDWQGAPTGSYIV